MKAHDKAWVVTVLMGLGHLRAAYPLRDLTHEGVVIYGSRRSTPDPEYGIWKRLRRVYYASSKAGAFPVLGKALVSVLLAVQRIPPYYPRSDQSRPTAAVRFLKRLVVRRGLCRSLRDKLATAPYPAVHTFYATAVAMDSLAARDAGPGQDQYLLICDADFNRVWVPEDAKRSRIRYLAPCTQVRRRLQAYGVSDEAIFLTGFPLPKENLGTETGLEVLNRTSSSACSGSTRPASSSPTTSDRSSAGSIGTRSRPRRRGPSASCSPSAARAPRPSSSVRSSAASRNGSSRATCA